MGADSHTIAIVGKALAGGGTKCFGGGPTGGFGPQIAGGARLGGGGSNAEGLGGCRRGMTCGGAQLGLVGPQ